MMNEDRVLALIRKLAGISDARESLEAIFAALKRFEERTRRYNRRHIAVPSPSEKEWTDIYTEIEPHAAELARALAAHRESFSRNLTTVLDGAAGLIDEGSLHDIDIPSILRQFRVQEALRQIDRVPSKLNVLLYSWGRTSLEGYRGDGMRRALEEAAGIEREGSYFANYFSRLLDRTGMNDAVSGG